MSRFGSNDMYEAIMMLPLLYGYKTHKFSRIAEVSLCLNNPEALVNFLTYFSGKTIRFPEISEIEETLKMIYAYKDNMEKGIKPSSILYYNALLKYDLKLTPEVKERFKKLTKYLRKIKNNNNTQNLSKQKELEFRTKIIKEINEEKGERGND